MPSDEKYCWVCAYIDSALIKHVEKELKRYRRYRRVEAFIPTVKILKKTFKKENFFEEVPLLFNYGFFKVPRKWAKYRDWLEQMRKDISCIYAWVQDPQKVIRTKPRLMADGGSVNYSHDGDIPIATATSREISELIRTSVNIGAHSAEDLGLLKEGDTVVLRGYPFEGISANLVEIDHKRKKVHVKIDTGIFKQSKEISVSFDNVFFTIYHNKNYYPDDLSKDSLDAMVSNNQLDKLFKKRADASSNE